MVHTKENETGFGDALECEAEGLKLLEAAIITAGVKGVRVPEVFEVNERQLSMTSIVPSLPSDALMEKLGAGLARIHDLPQSSYGFYRDNYIGLNPQPNGESDHWGRFFVDYRLGYQVSMISDDKVRKSFSEVLESQGEVLAQWLTEHGSDPALIHGDLWSGNVMFDQSSSWLIDPAVYFGDPEADLAMTEMFGGFGDSFYRAYHELRPRSKAYAQKRDIYNLYHFLNHYNLFGAAYYPACARGFSGIANL